jgi:thiol-disulfide isomerase/thioredoxin
LQRISLISLVVTAIVIAAAASYLLPTDSQSLRRLEGFDSGEMAGMEIYEKAKTPPDTRFEDKNGNEMELRDLRGRVTLVNFWATWCAPCLEEMPSFSRLQASIGGKDFQIVVISIDRDGYEVIEPFLRDLGVTNLPSYLDRSNRLTIEVGAIGLPTTLLLDKEGRIVGRMIGPAQWDSEDAIRLIAALTG